MGLTRKVPTLVDLCVQLAINNLRYIGDVGDSDPHLLDRILPHCTIDQLLHIERSTEGRDLSPVTDKLWKRFYGQQFGVDSVNLVIKRMKMKQVVFKWMHLFEAKTKERERAQQKSVDKLKELYAKEEDKKRSRQIKLCSNIPPSSSKRSFSRGSYDISGVKSKIMKRAKLEYLNSHEAKVHAAIRRNALQKMSVAYRSASRPAKPSASSSCLTAAKPPVRR